MLSKRYIECYLSIAIFKHSMEFVRYYFNKNELNNVLKQFIK